MVGFLVLIMAKKKFFDGDFLDDDPFEAMHEMMEEMFKGPLFRNLKPGNSRVQGMRITVGPDGRPRVQRFGDAVTQKRNAFEPWVDVIDGKNNVTVVAELPGVEKNELNLNAEKDFLTISVKNPERPVHKTIKLPGEVREGSAKATLKNGILEVVLEKKHEKKLRKIKVS